ncbi:MAG: hypothetical protein ACHP7M_00960 [Burkholderiales bacterium]
MPACDNRPSMDIDDPRVFPGQADAAQTPLFELAEASLAASSTIRSGEIDRTLVTALVQRLAAGDGSFVAELLAAAPSAPVARHLWRRLIEAWCQASRGENEERLAATLFAIPLVLVAAGTDGDAEIAGVLDDRERVEAILREHRALGGSEAFALASPLVASDTFDLARLPQLLTWQRQAANGAVDHLDLHPTPMAINARQEGVHLRFLAGVALAGSNADVLRETTAAWALPLAQELARQLAGPGYSVLALPRAPQSPLAALQQGRAAQREIGAQLFAGNAIRRLRASVGEPSAVISAHRCAGAPGGGELRLSLSSPFDPRQAEGFRCPLFAGDRVVDVAGMLADLMRDCRVADVQALPGVHADRDPATGMTLLFKADAIPQARHSIVH